MCWCRSRKIGCNMRREQQFLLSYFGMEALPGPKETWTKKKGRGLQGTRAFHPGVLNSLGALGSRSLGSDC
jgi:hypothetical protein